MPDHPEELANNNKELKPPVDSLTLGASARESIETTNKDIPAKGVPKASTHNGSLSNGASKEPSHNDTSELQKTITTLEGEVQSLREKLK